MQVIQHYQLIERIGHGGPGEVYRAIDTHNGATVAIKALERNIDGIARLQREKDILRQLNHPNIVKLLAMVEADGRQYLVLEYVSGGNLGQLLAQNGPLSLRRALSIANELADALICAHQHNIFHHDLKLSCILIGENGSPRLADFGLAHLREAAGINGTSPYASPEALKGEMVDARSDVWSFGVILYEMLAGRHPFVGLTPTQTRNNILLQPPPPLEVIRPDVPLALVDLVYRCLEKDPSARIPSARVLGLALAALIQGAPSSVQPSYAQSVLISAPLPIDKRSSHYLPVYATPFIGREMELAQLGQLLNALDTRFITIAGPSGIGKTRLAVEFGWTLVNMSESRFRDGVHFVDLAPQTRVEGVLTALAEALSYTFQLDDRTPQTQLIDYLRDKHMLLIVDNFEHVIGASGAITAILAEAPHVVIIVTSREPLNRKGERVLALGGLAVETASAQLFVYGVRREAPSFQLDGDNIVAVTHLCRAVGGAPLAILLAAAQSIGLNTPNVTAQPTHYVNHPIVDLAMPEADLLTLCDNVWRGLTEEGRTVFARMAIFRGGFTRDAALAICGGDLWVLMQLVNRALLERDPVSGRYHLHEVLRQYASKRLKESGAIGLAVRAHLAFFGQLAEEKGALLASGLQMPTLDIIETEIENIRLAWANAIVLHDEKALRQLANLLPFYDIRGRYIEAKQTYEAALAVMGDGDYLTSAYLLQGLCVFTYRLHQSDLSERYSRAAIEMCARLGEAHLALLPRAILDNILAGDRT